MHVSWSRQIQDDVKIKKNKLDIKHLLLWRPVAIDNIDQHLLDIQRTSDVSYQFPFLYDLSLPSSFFYYLILGFLYCK